MLCSWARQLTSTVPLSVQACKLVTANLMLGLTRLESHPEGVQILHVATCYRNQDKHCPDGPLHPIADLRILQTYLFDGHLFNFRLTLLWYHAVIRPFVALDEGSNEEGMQCGLICSPVCVSVKGTTTNLL